MSVYCACDACTLLQSLMESKQVELKPVCTLFKEHLHSLVKKLALRKVEYYVLDAFGDIVLVSPETFKREYNRDGTRKDFSFDQSQTQ